MQDDYDDREAYMGEIPEILYSLETGKPFKQCLVTGKDLTDPDTVYVIHKTYKGSEVILEYALTIEEVERMGQQFSKVSRDRLEEHLIERADFEERFEAMVADPETATDFEKWTSKCAFTGKPRLECAEFAIQALCKGNRVVYLPNSPILVSDDCMEMTQNLLSPQTRGFLDDFIGTHFPSPPEMADLPRSPVFFG